MSEITCAEDLVGMKRRPLTAKEIARVMKLSTSRVQQIENAALQKIRRAIERNSDEWPEVFW